MLDDALAHVEPFGDLALRKPLDLAHPHDAAAAFGQAVDQGQQAIIVDPAAGLALGRRAQVVLIGVVLRKGLDRYDPRATQALDEQVARDREEIRSEEHTSELQSLMRISY